MESPIPFDDDDPPAAWPDRLADAAMTLLGVAGFVLALAWLLWAVTQGGE